MTIAESCEQISALAADFRAGEVSMTPEHVQRWADQFSAERRPAFLAEFVHVLERTYISRDKWTTFLQGLVKSAELAGAEPKAFWKSANFLRIQDRGNSQKEMLELFDSVLQETIGLTLDDCGSDQGSFIYLDDVLFTGNHIRWDVTKWLEGDAPKSSVVHVIVIGHHPGRLWYIERQITAAAVKAGKKITLKWWRVISFEVRPGRDTEILQPASVPETQHVATLGKELEKFGHPIQLRQTTTGAKNGVFSNEAARRVLEDEFLVAGSRIKYELCPYLKQNHWPLGYDTLKTPGFGSLIVTFRNCANNCPLALWCGDPWYPLFAREVN